MNMIKRFYVALVAATLAITPAYSQTKTAGGTVIPPVVIYCIDPVSLLAIPQLNSGQCSDTGPGLYPQLSTPQQNNATGTTGVVVATLPAVAGKTTYACDFDVSVVGGSATFTLIVAGLLGGSKTYQITAGTGAVNLSKAWYPCIPGSGLNTAITFTTSGAAGATALDVNSSGFSQ